MSPPILAISNQASSTEEWGLMSLSAIKKSGKKKEDRALDLQQHDRTRRVPSLVTLII